MLLNPPTVDPDGGNSCGRWCSWRNTLYLSDLPYIWVRFMYSYRIKCKCV